MIHVDLHAHTFFSNCGIHSHVEMLTRARDLGMTALALTDHGPELGGRSSGIVYDRLHDPVEGVRYLKGMECNIVPHKKTIDLPVELLKYLDVVVVGVHPNLEKGLGCETYTRMLLEVIENHPCIDIIAHPNDPNFPLDFERVAVAAKRRGIALELNNSKTMLKRAPDSLTRSLVETCINVGCRMVVCSDAHALNELGRDDAVRPILEELSFPEELEITANADRALAFIESRREAKRG
ncbi:MAG: PHP domain-containing protein [Chitinivibrionales bacterium]|nr:PHP domain-containing protein [Chitinivibrionales bacterium]MBD3358889.1 PHP domain-containing protein [Chitinivibrionales bacterium]